MTAFIENVTAGDSLQIEENATGIDVSDPVVKAWLTIKTAPSVADPGSLQKIITTAGVPDVGQITQDGSDLQGNGTAVVVFQITASETATLGYLIRYYWDIQLKTNSGKIYTVVDEESGATVRRLQLKGGVTDATS